MDTPESEQEPDSPLVGDFIAYMRSVQNCERRLGELNFTWRLIEATTKMTCPVEAKTILPTMAATRRGFGVLERQLVESLVRENIRKVVVDIGLRAQVMVDVLVRNLFERTADVGFLATDTDLRSYLAHIQQDPDGEHHLERARIEERLREYRDKYTVYDEIVVLSCEGAVVAHLDHGADVADSRDALIAATLAADGYVETFRAVDFRPQVDRALVYSRKVLDPATKRPLGVLCLCFRFADEMAGIFESLRAGDDRCVMTLLDGDGRVIASSDEGHVRTGTQLVPSGDDQGETVEFAGREYLAQTRAARGYQGYAGPGWRGHVMVPVDTAFRSRGGDAQGPRLPPGTVFDASAFSAELEQVTRQAERINGSLRRVVWNGQVMASSREGDLLKLKSILQQISETGARTGELFRTSILDLYGTVVSSSMRDAQAVARLMIDIMDRNLFERAADCRWWGLAPELRRVVADAARSAGDLAILQETLDCINRLYTVYTRIFVYDRAGTILAASDLHGDGLEVSGRRVDEAILQRVTQLGGTQRYCVTPYEPTWLYGGRPAYVYHAAIRQPDAVGSVVGGIGIVFDGAREFPAMLRDALPARAGAFALFLERSGRVIASSSDEYAAGSIFPADRSFLALPCGASRAEIVTRGDTSFIAAASVSQGYREFKRSDEYSNDVVSILFVPLGARTEAEAKRPVQAAEFAPVQAGGEKVLDLATFAIGGQSYAVPASSVVECVEAQGLVPVRQADPLLAGVLAYDGTDKGTKPVVPVIDMHRALGIGLREPGGRQVVVLRAPEGLFGILVDDVVGVFEVDASQCEPVEPAIQRWGRFFKSIVKSRGDAGPMVLELDPGRLADFLVARDPLSA